jgi:hypothetical protein
MFRTIRSWFSKSKSKSKTKTETTSMPKYTTDYRTVLAEATANPTPIHKYESWSGEAYNIKRYQTYVEYIDNRPFFYEVCVSNEAARNVFVYEHIPDMPFVYLSEDLKNDLSKAVDKGWYTFTAREPINAPDGDYFS